MTTTTATEQAVPAATYTRRQVFKFGASAAGILGVIGVVGVVGPAEDAAAQRRADDSLVIPPDLPRLFGSPTDLAVNHPDIAWALETDGTVHRFDRDKRIWTPSGDRWEDVLATGTAFLAQWGRPSGLQRLVLVFGSTEPPPTTPPSTPPTTPPSTPPTTPPPSPGGGSSSVPSPLPSTATVPSTSGSSPYAGGTGGAGDTAGKSSLAYTGFDAVRMLVAAIGALFAGTVLTLWARRNAVASGPPPEEPDAPTPPTTAKPPPHR